MVYVAGAALALAAADIFVKAASGKVPNSLGMLLYGSIPFAAGLIWWLIDRRNIEPAAITTKGVVFALGVGIMFATVTFCMYAAFRQGAPISLASPIIRVGGLLVATIAGLVLWKEPMTMRSAAGLGLVCFGIYLILAR